MEKAKDHCQGENLEECEKDVTCGEETEEHGEESRHPSIGHRWTNFVNSHLSLLMTITFSDNECMTDMNRVVDAQAHCKDNTDARDDVNGDSPKVEEADQVGEREDDHKDDHYADLHVAEEQEGDDEDTKDSERQISPELVANDEVCFPGSVHFTVAEIVWRSSRLDCCSDIGPCRNVHFWPVQLNVSNAELG